MIQLSFLVEASFIALTAILVGTLFGLIVSHSVIADIASQPSYESGDAPRPLGEPRDRVHGRLSRRTRNDACPGGACVADLSGRGAEVRVTAVVETGRAPRQNLPRRSTAGSRPSSSTGTEPRFPTAAQTRRGSASSWRRSPHAGMDLAVVTGTHVKNVDDQLAARPRGPGRLLPVHQSRLRGLRGRRSGTSADRSARRDTGRGPALDIAAEVTVARLAERGLHAEIVSQRLNRRKIDLIPEPQWADPPKAGIGELLAAVEARLDGAGLGGLDEAVALARTAAHEAGLVDPRSRAMPSTSRSA